MFLQILLKFLHTSISYRMPYSTLLAILNEGKIGSASVDNVIQICKGLGITIQDLQSIQET